MKEQAINNVLDQIAGIEQELSVLERKRADEEARLDLTYDLAKAPIYKTRNAILSKIPGFWLTALENHALLSIGINDEDRVLLMALVSIEVERPEEDYRCFKIIFRFKQNRFLDDDIIQKELISTNGRVEAILHPIRWKKDMALSGMHAVGEHCGQERHLQDSFFDFFYDTSDESIEFANVLMSDFLPNVLSYYQGEDDYSDVSELSDCKDECDMKVGN